MPDAAAGADPQAAVEQLALAPADLSSGERSALIEGGDDPVLQVTLDYCGADFPSEELRIARRQDGVETDADNNVASSEVVVYKPGGAAQAFEEISAAVAECDGTVFKESNVVGVPPMRTESAPVDPALLETVADDVLAIDEAVTFEGRPPEKLTAIFQVRGDVLVATYSRDVKRAAALANSVGARLIALPESTVGA